MYYFPDEPIIKSNRAISVFKISTFNCYSRYAASDSSNRRCAFSCSLSQEQRTTHNNAASIKATTLFILFITFLFLRYCFCFFYFFSALSLFLSLFIGNTFRASRTSIFERTAIAFIVFFSAISASYLCHYYPLLFVKLQCNWGITFLPQHLADCRCPFLPGSF